MAKFSITMSDDLGKYIQETMSELKFDTTSEYFRHLVREDYARRKSVEQLRSLIDEGLKSGISDETVESIWDNTHKQNNIQ